MLCALTVRQLEPGTFEQFRDAFTQDFDEGSPPDGWVRFDMLRNVANPDEVICFGFFDGDLDALRAESQDERRDRQQRAIAPFVRSVGADGLYEIAVEYAAA